MISIDLNDGNVTLTPKKGAFLASLDINMVGRSPSQFCVWAGSRAMLFTQTKMLRNGRSFYRSDCGEMVATV